MERDTSDFREESVPSEHVVPQRFSYNNDDKHERLSYHNNHMGSSSVYSRPRARRPSSSSSVTGPSSPMRRNNSHQHTIPSFSLAQNDSSSASTAPPSLRTLVATLGQYLLLYWKHYSPSLRHSWYKTRRYLFYGTGLLLLVLLLWFSYVAGSFYREAVQMCRPPVHYEPPEHQNPLVEYYVHGRGNGHAARTMAIIQVLNDKGVDVRMYLGRASLWNVAAETTKNEETLTNQKKSTPKKGVTTVIAVTSIVPSLDIFSALSHILERIMGDCEVALQTNRYPLLVIADGDMPGMLRAKLGGIPSVGISHGQTFSIAQKPPWIEQDPSLSQAWDKEGRLNRAAAWFSSWQIGTNFVPLETQESTAVVARPPLKPEILSLRSSRRTAHPLAAVSGDVAARLANLVLYGRDEVTIIPTNGTSFERATAPRKLVLCYFRDQNGHVVSEALRRANFDVILFESGYVPGTKRDAHRYGSKWIVPETDRKRLRNVARLESEPDEERNNKTAAVRKEPRNKPRHPQQQGQLRQRRLTLADDNASQARIIRVIDRSLLAPFMSIADGIASSAGSQLMSECIHAQIPLFALFTQKDNEQMLNVEMSRQARAALDDDKLSVFGDSLEHFTEAMADGSSSASTKTTTSRFSLRSHKASSRSAGAKLALTEFHNFCSKVQASRVSENYFQSLASTRTEPVADSAPTTDEKDKESSDDPFVGMPDAAAILLEIIKQVQTETVYP